MPIDHEGTSPGLASEQKEEIKTFHMRCKAVGCDSILVTEMKIPGLGAGQRMYKCCKCPRVTTVAVGGAFNL